MKKQGNLVILRPKHDKNISTEPETKELKRMINNGELDPGRTIEYSKRKERQMAKKKIEEGRHKVTMYLSTSQILSMDRIKAKRMLSGASLSDVERTKLIREGIDMLIKKEGV